MYSYDETKNFGYFSQTHEKVKESHQMTYFVKGMVFIRLYVMSLSRHTFLKVDLEYTFITKLFWTDIE